MKNVYNNKKSRIKKPVLFICSQKSHRLFAMPVPSVSCFIRLRLHPKLKAKFRTSMFYLCLYHIYSTKCVVKMKELLRNF